MKSQMTVADEWLRRRIRSIYWEQWKKVKTKYRNLKALKLPEWKVHELVNSRKGYWRTAQVLSCALANKIVAQLGYISMLDYYLKICKKLKNCLGIERYAMWCGRVQLINLWLASYPIKELLYQGHFLLLPKEPQQYTDWKKNM